MNWQNIVPLIIAALFGFILKILHGKIFEKKVKLYFELDKPAVFSVIPPTVSFQNIKIFNKGNLPSDSIKVGLNRQIINAHRVTYKAGDEEVYDEEVHEKVILLKFAKLLPSEELTISFKSEIPMPREFLLSIKSDEMIARNVDSEKKSNEWMTGLISISVVSIVLFTMFNVYYYTSTTPKDGGSRLSWTIQRQIGEERAPFSLKLMTDKNIYSAGQKIEFTYQFINTGNEVLKDVIFTLEIPGIKLDYNTTYQQKSFIKDQEPVTFKRVIPIPADFPNGKHKAILSVSAKSLEKSLREESFVYFEVH